ncbi:MAG: DUF4112 domain-containing protein [Acidobacteriales bacterium]|nr:DUF4112 domain-containing protein [Terriglobales bacterium]
MKVDSEPVIIPPGQYRPQRRDALNDEALDQLAGVLDDIFQIPGTRIRFGLDALLGLIPGLGDAISGATSMLIIVAAWRRGLPRITLARMFANVAIDSLLGAMPLFGDLFDVWWKANRMNVNILRTAEARPQKRRWHDWLFFVLLLIMVAAIVTLPILLLIWVIGQLRS